MKKVKIFLMGLLMVIAVCGRRQVVKAMEVDEGKEISNEENVTDGGEEVKNEETENEEKGYKGFIYVINTADDTVTIVDYDEEGKNLVIPDEIEGRKVTGIADGVFSGFDEIKSIRIPNSVTHIGEAAFYCCSSLKRVTIPPNITRLEDRTFSYCSSLEEVVIPDSVTYIGKYAFSGCYKLKKVKVGRNVSKIGDYAFKNCKKLKSMTIKSSKITSKTVGKNVLLGTNKKLTIKVPKKKITAYKKFLKKRGNTKVKVKRG